jgi:hypothetical protein
MKRQARILCKIAVSTIAMFVATGCHSPVGLAMHVVGKVVDDVDADRLGNELIGKPPAAADAKLGKPVNVLAQVNGPLRWRVYSVPLDVMDNQRYVVQISNGAIAGVSKVKIDGTGIELARKLLFEQKVQGKSPMECEAALKLGPPVMTVRSETTGCLNQLYDARFVEGIGSPKYCRLRFDAHQKCDEVQLVDVSASSGSSPPS